MNTWIKIVSSTLPVCIILLVIAQFIFSNDLVSAGATVESVEAKITAISDENQLLEQQLAVSNSLDSIQTRATALGFVKAVSYLNVVKDQPVALR